jgi:hypothetical protein
LEPTDAPTATPDVQPQDPVPTEAPLLPPTTTPEVEVIPAGQPDPPAEPAPQPEVQKIPRPDRRDDPRSPDALADYDQRTWVLVIDAQNLVDACETEYDEANDEAKKKKRKLETAVEDLQKLIRERRDARGKPVQRTLLDAIPDNPDPPADGDQAVEVVAPAAEAAEDPLEHLWREYPLVRLPDLKVEGGATVNDIQKMVDGVRKKGLSARPLVTMGDMADYTANKDGSPDFDNRLTDFKGIGDAGNARILASESEFWRWWNLENGRLTYAREKGYVTDEQREGAAVAGGDAGPAADHAGGDNHAGEPAGPAPGPADTAAELAAVVAEIERRQGVVADDDFDDSERRAEEAKLDAEAEAALAAKADDNGEFGIG